MLPEEKIARRFSHQRKLKPPIDVESLVKEFAVLEEDDLPEGYDAIFLDKSAKRPRPQVLISNNLPPTRRIFTLGHELGHIIIPWHNGTHFCRVGAEARLVDDLVREIESQANRFAAELLMPAAWIEAFIKPSKTLKDIVGEVREAKVSCQAASIRLVQILPEGYAFAEVNADGVISRIQTTQGTRVHLPNEGEVLDQTQLKKLAEDSATFRSGNSTIVWWRFAHKLKAPKTIAVHKNATELLRHIVDEVIPDKAAGADCFKSVNGVIGAANGEVKRKQTGDLFTIMKQRFAHRSKLAEIVEHPLFDIFLQKRVEEISFREQEKPF